MYLHSIGVVYKYNFNIKTNPYGRKLQPTGLIEQTVELQDNYGKYRILTRVGNSSNWIEEY